MKNRLLLLAVGLAACAPQSPAPLPRPATGPAQRPAPTAAAPSRPDSVIGIAAKPQPGPMIPAADSNPEAERLANLKLAADSAADARLIEQLADLHPEVKNPSAAPVDQELAEAKSLNESDVTWEFDVETFAHHDRVQFYLDFFQGPGRGSVERWMVRLPVYEQMIRRHFRQRDLPGDLVYLALIESSMSNTAVSSARAVGMWQFMKPTARFYNLRVDHWIDERRDPYVATPAAAHFLSDLKKRFGSLYLAAAAYNAGGGKISRGLNKLEAFEAAAQAEEDDEDEEEAIDESGSAVASAEADSLFTDAAFFRLYDSNLILRETKDYVPKLIAAALIAKQPERYGFQRDVDHAPAVWDSLIVPDMTGLDVMARLAGTTVATIRELNPKYVRLATPPGERMVVRVPSGTGSSVRSAYAAMPSSFRVSFHVHRTSRGQSVAGIARQYSVGSDAIYEANPWLKGRRLRTGQRVVVPTGGVMSAAVARRIVGPEPGVYVYHTVRRGETLSGIAARYDVSTRKVAKWNHLRSLKVRYGQRLRVQPPKTHHSRLRIASARGGKAGKAAKGSKRTVLSARAPANLAAATVHRVRSGETLTGVAKRYGVSLQSLLAANRMSGMPKVRAGTTLKIPA